jgi:hypothetical protein
LAEFSSILWFSPPLCVHRLLSVRASKPSDMPIDYKVYSFLRLHSDFRYNSLGSICTCYYLIIGTNVSQSTSSSKLNFRFVSSLTVLYWKGHNSSIRSMIEVNEHKMEILFDKLI